MDTLSKAIKLLHEYNEMIKRDPQYKLNKCYSPKTNIDEFLYSDEVLPTYKKLLSNTDIIRKSKHVDFGDYEKSEYIVELLNGEVVVCWPNAGCMNAMDATGRIFKASDVHSFKLKIDI